MRKVIISLSIILFLLSGLITLKALSIPATAPRYQSSPEVTESGDVSPVQQDILEKLSGEQTANRELVEKLQATISKLEDELSRKGEEVQRRDEPEAPGEKPRILTVLGAGAFQSGQVVVNEDMMGVVKELVPEIQAYPDRHVIIEGHTDNIPISTASGRQYRDNMDLSFLRAKAVARILFDSGISPERVSIIGYGDTRPIAPNDTEEGRVRNRRVEVKLAPGDKER